MNNDFLPPASRRPQSRPPQPAQQGPVISPVTQEQPRPELQHNAPVSSGMPDDTPDAPKKSSMSLGKKIAIIFASFLGFMIIVGGSGYAWYQQELQPVSTDVNAARVRVTIERGTTPDDIGSLLVEKKVIKSSLAFEIYTRVSGTRNNLQAGVFSLSPRDTTAQIIDHLVAGKTDQFTITFLPGATLAQNKKVLLTAGYSEQEINTALSKTYSSPLFQDKPATADLEGYIYGETYTFTAGATVEQILQRTFEEYYAAIRDNGLIAELQTQGLNLYQGITLASIIQREVATKSDMKQVAQVFLKRYKEGIMLGSDVTYQYAADKLGVERDTNLDSPYNTRRFVGLPPGPIATPGLAALQATAAPAPGDYLFFLSGDDDVTYFARTDAEHQENIKNHCLQKCSVL